MDDFLNQPVNLRKRPGKITVVGYLGIGMGLFFIVAGVAGALQRPLEPGLPLFVILIGFLAAVGCYLGVRR